MPSSLTHFNAAAAAAILPFPGGFTASRFLL
jgi:hypothetical protein